MTVDPVVGAGADARRFSSARGEHVLIVPFSQIYDLPGRAAAEWDSDPARAAEAIAGLTEPAEGDVALGEVPEPAPQSISLNVSNACNLSCSYCYASRGDFGGRQSEPMSATTARAAVDRLLDGGDPDAPFTVGFLGGEPFVNRRLIRDVVEYAARRAAARVLDVRFSVTTNGTLLEPDDLALLRMHSFAVTVSVDGDQAVHDRQRPESRPGRASWAETVRRVRPLLESPGRARIAARATVTRSALDPARLFRALVKLGFADIGLSPLRRAPVGALRDSDWPVYLAALIALASEEIAGLKRGEPLRLTNLAVALKQLHRGAASPYPCGAGGGYFSVAADGTWYACHRAIGEPEYALGNNAGLLADKRRAFLKERHVHSQTDCATCWARYLCSGGCHQEAATRSSASCDFIRGWLDFCLRTYTELGPVLTRTQPQVHS
jgi:uncharacterized protein